MWRCVREDEVMLEHTEELPEMGGQLDALEMLGSEPDTAFVTKPGSAPNSALNSGVMASVMASVPALKMPDKAFKLEAESDETVAALRAALSAEQQVRSPSISLDLPRSHLIALDCP